MKNVKQHMQQLEELKLQHAEEDSDRHWKTALINHAMKNNHKFDFNKFKPIHFEKDNRKRKKLESLYIYSKHHLACNFKQDTLDLNVQSKQIINACNY